MSIKSVEIYRYPAELTQPYHTSFGDLPFFDAVIVAVHADEGSGFGESSAVPGYSWETPDDVWNFVTAHAPQLVGESVESAEACLKPLIDKNPFGVTPLLCAVEECVSPSSNFATAEIAGILNVAEDNGIAPGVEDLLSKGFKTIKFKIGFDVIDDIRRARLVQASLNGRARLRLDANQHYSLGDAKRFVAGVSPEGIELLEQPFDSHDWEKMIEFASECPLPLMLDESIYGSPDILRAADSQCCSYIKLKLCKAGGMRELREQGLLAAEKNLKLVIGNGVATDISCRQEIRIAFELAELGVEIGAGEMNGFLKQKTCLAQNSIVMSGAMARLNPESGMPDFENLRKKASICKIFESFT